jgi:hypothetical protein
MAKRSCKWQSVLEPGMADDNNFKWRPRSQDWLRMTDARAGPWMGQQEEARLREVLAALSPGTELDILIGGGQI